MGSFDIYCFICGGPFHGSEMFKNINFILNIINSLNPKNRKKFMENFNHTMGCSEILNELEDAGHITSTENDKMRKNECITAYDINKYKWLYDLLLLHTSGKIIEIDYLETAEGEVVSKNGEVYWASSEFRFGEFKEYYSSKYKMKQLKNFDPRSKNFWGDGYLLHKDCYNLMKGKHGSFNINNIYLDKINYGYIERYMEQFIPWVSYFMNDDEYLLESPLKNKKNKSRILKIKHPIQKISIKDRPSPSESAKTFPIGKTKEGNDGNMWEVVESKTGVKKWGKLKHTEKRKTTKKVRPSPTVSATKYKIGERKIGNDGNMWEIVENKNGVKRWKKLKKQTGGGTIYKVKYWN